MNQSYSNHKALVLSRIVFIHGIQSVRLKVLNDRWFVPRNEVLEFHHGDEKEQVIYDEGIKPPQYVLIASLPLLLNCGIGAGNMSASISIFGRPNPVIRSLCRSFI